MTHPTRPSDEFVFGITTDDGWRRCRSQQEAEQLLERPEHKSHRLLRLKRVPLADVIEAHIRPFVKNVVDDVVETLTDEYLWYDSPVCGAFMGEIPAPVLQAADTAAKAVIVAVLRAAGILSDAYDDRDS